MGDQVLMLYYCVPDKASVTVGEFSSASASVAMETERLQLLKGEAPKNGYIVPSSDHLSEM